jgi:hypothetical protein
MLAHPTLRASKRRTFYLNSIKLLAIKFSSFTYKIYFGKSEEGDMKKIQEREEAMNTLMLNNIKMQKKYLCLYSSAIISINNSPLLSFSPGPSAGLRVTANLVASKAQPTCN